MFHRPTALVGDWQSCFQRNRRTCGAPPRASSLGDRPRSRLATENPKTAGLVGRQFAHQENSTPDGSLILFLEPCLSFERLPQRSLSRSSLDAELVALGSCMTTQYSPGSVLDRG